MNKALVIVGSIVGILLAAVLFMLFVIPKITENAKAEIPDVTGMSISQAENALENEGFEVEGKTKKENSDKIGKDKVISTDPEIGRMIKKGTKVVLTVSKGSAKIKIDNYKGQNYYDVKAKLENAQITVIIDKKDVPAAVGEDSGVPDRLSVGIGDFGVIHHTRNTIRVFNRVSGEQIVMPAAPSSDYYNFLGWKAQEVNPKPDKYSDPTTDADADADGADSDLLQPGDKYTITDKDVVFYAQWKKKTFTVKYYLPDETGAWVEKNMETVDSVDYATHSLWTPDAKNGYKFSGWYQKADDIGVKAKVEKLYMAKEWKLYGKFTPIEYTIQYVYNDGKATSTNPTTYTVESDTITLADATGADWGKTFLEWHDENGQKIADEEADYTGTYRDIQWKNKTITELYYPGSVFKVITSAMGIDAGLANINTTFTCNGAYAVAKHTYHCAGHKAHGTLTLADALRQSCNIYYVQLGQRLGSQLFYNYFDAFGFTSRTGVDLPSETNFMQYYNASQLGEVQLASSAFGQAMAITPLQMCTAVAAAVNGGYLVTPHVVDKITDTNGNVVEEIGTNIRRQVISESTSDVIRQMMEYEVGNGTGGGKNAYVSGYRIGGKSGTSEQLNMHRRADGDYKKVASFVAVLPANDPEILVYVMLDDPNNAKTDYSSILAAPVAGNIISEVAPYLGIATDGEDRSGKTPLPLTARTATETASSPQMTSTWTTFFRK